MNQEQTILVFAGAGASKAVAPEKYPTTIEFFENLPENITKDRLFDTVVSFLSQEVKNNAIDIELLLWRLGELKAFCHQIYDQNSLAGWILAGNRLAGAIGARTSNLNEVFQLARSGEGRLRALVDNINARVYELYVQLPSESQLSQTWHPLLKGLEGTGAKIEIVTTNYDMILEAALDKNKIVDIGWRGSVVRTLDTQLWISDRSKQPRGLLTKLHGSVNWTRGTDEIFVSDPTFKGSHDTHVIIYPGFKGRPVDPTFLAFHNHFALALQDARVALFIGFAFRDEYINDLCERSVTGKTKIGIINPDPDIESPFANSKPVHWKDAFDKKSVDLVLEFVKTSLGL